MDLLVNLFIDYLYNLKMSLKIDVISKYLHVININIKIIIIIQKSGYYKNFVYLFPNI